MRTMDLERRRTMRKEYHKLVRDCIPEIIRQRGEHAEVVGLNETDYLQALSQKLVEEAQEAAMASSEEDLVTELADLSEVMEALIKASGSSRETVRRVQAKRRAERGGFTQRLLLVWTEDEPTR